MDGNFYSAHAKAFREMITNWPCKIEAVFGSINRSDFDRLSDIDYLIADDDCRALSMRKDFLVRAGFSVSDYSLKRLRSIFAKRTLFAAHLKLESRVVFDIDGEFEHLTKELNENRDYAVEHLHARRLFSPLRHIPDSSLGSMWALDHLAVAFRNASIVAYASTGKFIFSQNELLNAYCRDGQLSNDEVKLMRQVRLAKQAYRARRILPNAKAIAREAIELADRVMGLDLTVNRPSMRPLASLAEPSDSTDAYVSLREIERELVTFNPRNLDLETATVQARLWRTVRDPHEYLWRTIYDREKIQDDLHVLREQYW